jgi:hypothetical protein
VTTSSLRRRLARIHYVALALATLALGLAVHWRGDALSNVARDVLGDALWAAMVVWWMAALAPAVTMRLRALMALAFCFAVEISQLYHAPWLDAIRGTAAGHLVLGSGFDPRDFIAYAAGVLAAVFADLVIVRRRSATPGRVRRSPAT